MTKQAVLDFFGGYKPTARALDYTDAAIRMWPDRLSPRIAAQVLVAAIQTKGIEVTRAKWPAMFERTPR